MTDMALTNDPCDLSHAERLLRLAGIDGAVSIEPIPGGLNNRTAKVTTRSGHFLLKQYAQNPADQRDRLHSETAFCRYAREIGIDVVPMVLAVDAPARTVLFSFIQGRQFVAHQVDATAVSQAIAFVLGLNRRREVGAHLPNASEAGFSLDEHDRAVRMRFASLCKHVRHEGAARFLQDELGPIFEDIECRSGPALAADERCISPSDFGFHNAIRAAGGRITFVDFEYAGWDDPARMICDFFLQVAVPVPVHFLPCVVRALAPHFGGEMGLSRRVVALMPLYHAKWCCLLLNDFHPDARSRRLFAGVTLDADHLDRQLARARARMQDRSAVAAAQALVEDRA